MSPAARAKPRASKNSSTGASGGVRWQEAAGSLARGAFSIVSSPDFGRLVLGALVCAGFGAASWRVKARVVERPCFQIERADLVRAPLPEFLSDRAREDLAQIELPTRVSAFEPGLVGQLGLSLRKLPWVESVENVNLEFDARRDDEKLLPHVSYALRIARPIARVKERGGESLIARSGRRIPADRVQGLSLPRIDGLPDETSLERIPALDEALALVQALGRRGLVGRLGIESISLVKVGNRRDVQFSLTKGPKIDFGPAGDALGTRVEERLDRLEGFLQKGPPLEQVEKLSVRWDDPVYVLAPVAVDPVAAVR